MIAQVNESHGVTLAAQFEPEKTAVKRQRLFDIPHLKRNVVEPYNARSREFSHWSLSSASQNKELNG